MKFKTVHIVLFMPYTGYVTNQDGHDMAKKRDYYQWEKTYEQERIELTNEFINSFVELVYNDELIVNKNVNFKTHVTNPTIYQSSKERSVQICLSTMNDDIQDYEESNVYLIYLINQKYLIDFNFTDKLPFTNFITYNY